MRTDIRLIFVTMLRPDCARRFVQSVRQFHPDVPITIAEQANGAGDLADIDGDVRRIVVPFDLGLAASRNRLIEALEEEFFLLGDDDFYAVEPFRLETAIAFMRANPDTVFLGGQVTDYYFSPDKEPKRVDMRRDSNIAIDTTARGVVLIPRSYIGGEARTFDGEDFLRCDYVANWGIGRTSFFNKTGFRWSDALKVGHEHIDFFLRLKMQHPEARVFYWSGLAVDHHRHRDANDEYLQYRRRDEYIALYGQQQDLQYLCDPVIGRVQFFDDFRNQILFPRPDRERADRYKQRVEELRATYFALQEKYAELRAAHLALKERHAKSSK